MTDDLPTEVLDFVFGFVVVSLESLMCLINVSKRWRAVAWHYFSTIPLLPWRIASFALRLPEASHTLTLSICADGVQVMDPCFDLHLLGRTARAVVFTEKAGFGMPLGQVAIEAYRHKSSSFKLLLGDNLRQLHAPCSVVLDNLSRLTKLEELVLLAETIDTAVDDLALICQFAPALRSLTVMGSLDAYVGERQLYDNTSGRTCNAILPYDYKGAVFPSLREFVITDITLCGPRPSDQGRRPWCAQFSYFIAALPGLRILRFQPDPTNADELARHWWTEDDLFRLHSPPEHLELLDMRDRGWASMNATYPVYPFVHTARVHGISNTMGVSKLLARMPALKNALLVMCSYAEADFRNLSRLVFEDMPNHPFLETVTMRVGLTNGIPLGPALNRIERASNLLSTLLPNECEWTKHLRGVTMIDYADTRCNLETSRICGTAYARVEFGDPYLSVEITFSVKRKMITDA